jgi:Uma2 family endonuclease
LVIRTRATYADVLTVPPEQVAELIDGELIVTPRPAIRHALASMRLGGTLIPPFDKGGNPGGWVFLGEPELHFGDDVVVPDLAGWRRERFPAMAEGDDPAFITVVPDWVCEVASPRTERVDRGRKMAVYAAAGVSYLWLVQPSTQTLEAYRLDAERRWTLLDVYSEGHVRVVPFDAIEFNLAVLWVA